MLDIIKKLFGITKIAVPDTNSEVEEENCECGCEDGNCKDSAEKITEKEGCCGGNGDHCCCGHGQHHEHKHEHKHENQPQEHTNTNG